MSSLPRVGAWSQALPDAGRGGCRAAVQEVWGRCEPRPEGHRVTTLPRRRRTVGAPAGGHHRWAEGSHGGLGEHRAGRHVPATRRPWGAPAAPPALAVLAAMTVYALLPDSVLFTTRFVIPTIEAAL